MLQKALRQTRRRCADLAGLISMTLAWGWGTQLASASDRYWVGLSGYWDETAHWSNTSGGAGGFSMPANGDNVYIIANNTFTVNRDVFTPSYTLPGPLLVRLAGTGGAVV